MVAVWIENGSLFASDYDASNQTWSNATTVTNSGTVTRPRLGMATNGDAVVTWLAGSTLKWSRKAAGGNWTAVGTISASGASQNELSVDTSGNAVATWTRASLIETSTMLTTGLFPYTWSLVNSFLTTNSDNPAISIGGSGKTVIVWHAVASGANVIMYSTYTLGGSWSTPAQIFTVTVGPSHTLPRVAVDSLGNATAAWFRYIPSGSDYTNVSVLTATLPSGAPGWSIPVVLSDPSLISQRNPADLPLRVRYDASSNVIVLWGSSQDGGRFDVQAATKTVGGNWSTPIQFATRNLYAFSEDVATNAAGEAVLLFMVDSGSSIDIQSTASSFSGGLNIWSTAIPVSDGTQNAYPRVASTLVGNVMNAGAVWVGYDGSNTRIHSSSGLQTLVSPPTSLGVVQNSTNNGVFTEYYNTITWTASASPGVIEYLVFRNGVFVAELAASQLSYVDHNTTNGGAVTYGVVAVDGDFTQSLPATVSYP
jgi:hypothetical protein